MSEIALLIPHYNNFKGLIRSLSSINEKEQIDVIIVDDGSNIDKINEDILRNVFKAKGEIFYIYLDINKGIECALNVGLDFIIKKKYLYTARLDAGDVCLGERFKIQHKFLLDNPDIKFIGSNADAYDLNDNFLFKYNFPTKHIEIKKRIHLQAVFVHPTFMFDNEILDKIGFYPINYIAAEDFAFTMKVVKNFKTANIDNSLVRVEINPAGISISKRKKQIWSRLKVLKDNYYIGFYPSYGLIRNFLICLMPDKWLKILKNKKNK